MMSEEEIRRAAFNWRAVADALKMGLEAGGKKSEFKKADVALADGYASALEMVLRGD